LPPLPLGEGAGGEGVDCAGRLFAFAAALLSTALSILWVRRPVNVFCWLGWYEA
jgi:hypothetical protein